MKFTSTIFAASSGSIAGATFSRNRGGQYVRRRAIPANPNSEAQGIARTNLAAAVSAWTNTLTAPQRTGWASYAQATPRIDPIGQQILLSGQQMFVRSCTVALIGGQPIPAAPPVDSGLGVTPDWLTDPVVDASTQLITGDVTQVTADPADIVYVYMSRPVPNSRTPAHETKRFATAGAFTADPFGVSAAVPFPVTTGQRVRVTCLMFDTQHRVSAVSFRDVVVQA